MLLITTLKNLGITLDVENDNIKKMEFPEENSEKIVDYLYKFISDEFFNDKSHNYFTTEYPECYDECSNLESKSFYVK